MSRRYCPKLPLFKIASQKKGEGEREERERQNEKKKEKRIKTETRERSLPVSKGIPAPRVFRLFPEQMV